MKAAKEFLEKKYGKIDLSNKDGFINGNFWKGLIEDMNKFSDQEHQSRVKAISDEDIDTRYPKEKNHYSNRGAKWLKRELLNTEQ